MTIYDIRPAPLCPENQALIMAGRMPAGKGWLEKGAWFWKIDSAIFDGSADLRALTDATEAYEAKHAGR